MLLAELGAYQPDLLERERVVVGSRADLVAAGGDGDRAAGVELDLRVSAVTGPGYAAHGPPGGRRSPRPGGPAGSRASSWCTAPSGPATRWCARAAAGWSRAARPTRAVALSDLTRPDALAEAHRRLHRLGVDRALARAGARPGDPVRIGSLVFDYEDDEAGT